MKVEPADVWIDFADRVSNSGSGSAECEMTDLTGARRSVMLLGVALPDHPDFSSTGLLCECGVRLKVGSPVQVMFEGEFAPASASGRVARCEVVAMAPGGVLRYHIGVEFNSPIPLDDIVTDSPPKPEVVPDIAGRLSASRTPVPHVIRNRW